MASRRKAREALLKALYVSESRNMSVEKVFVEMEALESEENDEAINPELYGTRDFILGLDENQKAFALKLSNTIDQSKDALNEQIKGLLRNWDFSRVSRIDRMILWIALAEMTGMPDIPVSVSINEAIELSKAFSSPSSASFINGILDSAAKKMGIHPNDNKQSEK